MSQSSDSSGDGKGECTVCKSKYFDTYHTCNGKAGIDCQAYQEICQGCGGIREEIKCYCENPNAAAPAANL
jgi:hypothetical protein